MTLKKKSSERKEKFTLYLSTAAASIYRQGHINKWDVSDLATEAVTAAILENKDQLLKPARESSDPISVVPTSRP